MHGQATCGGFSLNYDFHTPLRAIDFGGPDQEQRSRWPSYAGRTEYSKLYRMGEFFTRSIDNLSHGLTVSKARESLGLKECVCSVDFIFRIHKKMQYKRSSFRYGSALAQSSGNWRRVVRAFSAPCHIRVNFEPTSGWLLKKRARIVVEF